MYYVRLHTHKSDRGPKQIQSTHLRLKKNKIFENDRYGSQQSEVTIYNEERRHQVEPRGLPEVLDLPIEGEDVIEIEKRWYMSP